MTRRSGSKEVVSQQPQAVLFPDFAADDVVDQDGDGDFIDTSRLGRYAEFMVCAELTRLGYRAIHVDAPGFDIILTVEDRSLRVQVKSTTSVIYPPLLKANGGPGRKPRTQPYAVWNCTQHVDSSRSRVKRNNTRRLTPGDADIIALFHHKFGNDLLPS
jgi:hypothetical protein